MAKGKRSYYAHWWDEEDGFYESKPRTKVVNTWGYKSQFTTIFGSAYSQFDWSSVYSKSSSREEIREMKEKLSDICNKKYIPIKINCSWLHQTPTFWRLNRVIINVSPELLKDWTSNNKQTERLVRALEKLPPNSHLIHSHWVLSYMHENHRLLKWTICSDERAYKNYVVPYFEGSITYEEIISQFRNPTDEEINPNVWGKSLGEFSWGREVWNLQIMRNTDAYKTAIKLMGKKFVKQSRAEFTESIRWGSRINPNYLNKTSYKPLLVKSIAKAKVPKVMFILDCSGSMGLVNYAINPSHKAVSLMSAMINSWVCETTHAVYHSDRGWRDMAWKIKAWTLAYYSGCGDWFDFIDDNLPSDWVKNVDYVIALTDLEYEENAQWGLLDYLKRAPAHLVLSFKNTPKVDWINAVVVDRIEDMVKAVTKFQSKYL